MDNYEDKSDFQINTAVKHALGLRVPNLSVSPELNLKWHALDYCNNPSDAWPIITENYISIFHTGKHQYGWVSSTDANSWHHGGKNDLRGYDENPLRAAMIVFLKMQEQES